MSSLLSENHSFLIQISVFGAKISFVIGGLHFVFQSIFSLALEI